MLLSVSDKTLHNFKQLSEDSFSVNQEISFASGSYIEKVYLPIKLHFHAL